MSEVMTLRHVWAGYALGFPSNQYIKSFCNNEKYDTLVLILQLLKLPIVCLYLRLLRCSSEIIIEHPI